MMYWAVLSSGAVHYAVQNGFNFHVRGWNPKQTLSMTIQFSEPIGQYQWQFSSAI